MKSIHPTFQQVTRQGTLFNQAVKGGPKPGGKKASKPKKAMKKKAERVVFRMSGDAENETDPKLQDVPKHMRKLWRETPTETKVKAGAAGAGGIGAALLARKLLKKKAGVAKTDVEAAVRGATKQNTEITGQAGDRMDPNDSSVRYGGGLGNLGKAKAPKFTDKVNPTEKPKVFRKMDKIASPFLSGFLDEFIKVSEKNLVPNPEAKKVLRRAEGAAQKGGRAVEVYARPGRLQAVGRNAIAPTEPPRIKPLPKGTVTWAETTSGGKHDEMAAVLPKGTRSKKNMDAASRFLNYRQETMRGKKPKHEREALDVHGGGRARRIPTMIRNPTPYADLAKKE